MRRTSAVRYDDFHHGDNCLDGTVGYRIKGIVEPMVGGQIMAEWRGLLHQRSKSLQEQMGDDINLSGKAAYDCVGCILK